MRGIHNRCTPPWPHGSFAAGVCLCANLERHQLSATELPPMRLFRDGGKLHSLSNRRLFVFRVLRLDGFVWRPSSLIQKTLEFFPRLSNRSPHWRHFRTLLCWCQCWKLETGGQAVLKFIQPRNNHERVKNRWKSCHYVMVEEGRGRGHQGLRTPGVEEERGLRTGGVEEESPPARPPARLVEAERG